tara:strand:+ start:53 stop:436 length:384 start_codon:yes stop_codon:yes gene_type:complete
MAFSILRERPLPFDTKVTAEGCTSRARATSASELPCVRSSHLMCSCCSSALIPKASHLTSDRLRELTPLTASFIVDGTTDSRLSIDARCRSTDQLLSKELDRVGYLSSQGLPGLHACEKIMRMPKDS